MSNESNEMSNVEVENKEIDSKETTEEKVFEFDDEHMEAAIEAILFSMGDAVPIKTFEKLFNTNAKKLDEIFNSMSEKYNDCSRGIKLVKLEDSYQLCTKNEYFDVLSSIVNMPKKHNLTDSLMETLSIVAYKQPVTRQEIETIRGVSCVHAINKLVEYNLIGEVGRLDAIGRPILFGTTPDFLRCFGVSSMDELPIISPDKIEDFKKEAMEEAEIRIET